MRKKNIISKFAKKDLGQNFLHNVQVRDDILEEAGDISEKKILEIGPGLGFLTSSLLATKADVYAVEFDKRVAEIISRDFGHMKNFHLFNVDFLQFDLDDLFKNDKYSIIANIPYNITAPIFRKVLEKTENKPEFAIFMVQKEVGQKVCKPKKRSILSVSVEVFAEVKYCFTVSRTDFNPVPKVDSAIIRFDIRKKSLVEKDDLFDFFTVVNAGFSQKRKKVGNFLGKYFGIDVKLLLGDIDPNRRSETFEIEEWIKITKNFQKFVK